MIDGKTLLFSSDRSGGKGGMDLYQTTMEYGQWTRPVPLNYINSEKNEEFVSVPARGDILYYHDKYKEHFQLYKAMIPPELRPKNVRLMTGEVSFMNAPPMDALVQAIDISTGKSVASVHTNPSDGSFFMVLSEGSRYDFSVFPLQPGFSYHAEILDLDSIGRSTWEKPEYSIGRLSPGSSFVLQALQFEERSNSIAQSSNVEMRRLSRFMKQNAGNHFEINAYIDTLRTDTIPSPSLTEISTDTVFITLIKEELITEDSAGVQGLNVLNEYLDSGFVQFEESRKEIVLMKVNSTYHNDRSEMMAQAVVDYLVGKGAPSTMFTATGHGDHYSQNFATPDKNYWIEVKLR
jgi:hypothetical protein